MRDLFAYLLDDSLGAGVVPSDRDAFIEYARTRLATNRPVGLTPTALGLCLQLADGTLLRFGPALASTDERAASNVYVPLTHERFDAAREGGGSHVPI